MKQASPLFDADTHYRIEIDGLVDAEWLQGFDSPAEIIVDEFKMTENTTVLHIHTDQSGIVGLLRRLHGLGMTIQKFQIIT